MTPCAPAEIIGVGLSVVDQIFVAETVRDDVVYASDYLVQGGGLTSTSIAAAARLGAKTEVWTRVGDDLNGRFVTEALAAEGVDVGQVQPVPRGQTPVCIVHVEPKTAERKFIFFPGAGLDAAPIPPLERLDRAQCLLVDAHWPEAALPAAERAHRADVPVVTDVEHADGRLTQLAPLTDVLVVPEQVGEAFREGDDFAAAARRLQDLGPERVVITLGPRGGVYRDGEREGAYEAFAVEAVDTTGAGDVFHGAVAYGLCQGWEFGHILRFAAAAGALNCRRLGGRAGMPRRHEVDALVRARDGSARG